MHLKTFTQCFYLLVITMLCLGEVSAQTQESEITVKGTVRDELNAPLIGVSVLNLNTRKAVSTDIDGRFSILASRGDSLLARYIGYKDYRTQISTVIELNIVLQASNNSLNEVVVVGYGQQKKISLVGAQSSVNVEALQVPVANLSTALAGRIAGLVGVQRTGLPGSNTADVWIRGISTFNSLNSASPLVIVDGVQGRNINAFDPEDIASFTVLKDASATAVYGAQGANGVILITTKKGRVGKPSLMFNYNQGITAFTRTPELANGEQYMRLRNEARVASGSQPDYSQEYIDNTLSASDPVLYPNVDWMNTLFSESAANRRINFAASGGSETTQYYSSLAYYDETSLLKTDKLQSYNADTRFRRYNFTSNVDMNWTKTTRFSLGVQGYITNTNYPGTNPQEAFGRVMQTNPVLYPVMLPGNLVPGINTSRDYQPNPYALVTQTGYQNIFQSQLYSNAAINQDLSYLVKGLSARAMFSFDTWNSHTINRTRLRTLYAIDRSDPYDDEGNLNLAILANGSDALGYNRNNSGDRKFYAEAAVNYERMFGDHSVSAMILYNQNSNTAAFADNLTSSLPTRTQGLAGRATYSWKDKYFGEFNFGYNGSENFAPGQRYGFFPSFGAGWVLSNEEFFSPLKEVLPFFKLRYSNGWVGSGSGGRRFGYLTIVSTGASGYTFGNGTNNTGFSGLAISDYGANVVWAKSHKQDLGLEFKTLKSLLSVTVDYFKEHRSGVFLQRGSLANYLGLQTFPFGNLGVIDNEGFDGTIDLAPFKVGQTAWSFHGTFSYNKDKVIENDDPVQPFPYMERRGNNYLSRYGYIADGLFQSQAEIDAHADQSALGGQRVGDIRYRDLNGDNIIDAYDQARIGNGDVPNLVYGAGFNVTFKGFYVGAFFQGINGADRLLGGDGIIPFNNSNGGERSNLYSIAEDRWTEDNPVSDPFYPRLAFGNSANRNNAVASSWWVKDIDFIRLKTVDIGYNLPAGSLKNLSVKSARIYFQGVNVLYWSKFKLWDPELNTSNGASYPNTRTFSLGAQVNF
ncbi:TonB-linked SusC/RagA family outer membrane protein [Arcticibacter tournemirensis]|uniref:TonB-dependent receptor n=1 Tax=Arcticibacter tournemirensis TaxID=699437 RepID=A0A5M9HEG5_9SPHI|nr:TonB-dependent receptor [Arcticibacter tournemirensis]KAA8485376.1 TonB-dependent receptor [Arcticibacter tournemirensis]TQM50333.1 TonB-linked SusC/RagA family outer membrane protein [Arcticibacter tournemirensis]